MRSRNTAPNRRIERIDPAASPTLEASKRVNKLIQERERELAEVEHRTESGRER